MLLSMPQYIRFTTVEPDGPDRVRARGQGHVDGMTPYPVAPILFVRSDNEWKLSHLHVCGILATLPGPDGGCQ
ncbi:conserved hypothetical protein [Rhodococcus sp. RD6.2]|nr:conserved hypothetical protein [Rhodococcus sp. RD6.2]